jgi:hypothetical protein
MLAEVAERDRGHMGFMLQPWHLIVIAVGAFLLFLTIGRMSKRP